MNSSHIKCVMVINPALPCGVIANTAAILGISLGAAMPGLVGCPTVDADGCPHAGIIRFPVPVLGGNAAAIKELRDKLLLPRYSSLIAVDFSDLSQRCKCYEEFLTQMPLCAEMSLTYLGIALCGDRKTIDKLTGNLPLLRESSAMVKHTLSS